jgi:hypothetical protein
MGEIRKRGASDLGSAGAQVGLARAAGWMATKPTTGCAGSWTQPRSCAVGIGLLGVARVGVAGVKLTPVRKV